MEAFLAGWAGGLSFLAVSHPMEVVKVTLQSHQLHSATGAPPYRNSLDCAIKIFLGQTPEGGRGGIGAFYRGVAAPVAGIGLSTASVFGTYGYLKALISSMKHPGEREVGLEGHLQNTTDDSVAENCLCATGAAIVGSTIMTPFELIKMRLVSSQFFEHREYFGALDCARKLYRQGGVPKLYRGWSATMIRDVPGAIAFFGCYGLTRQVLPQDAATFNIASILFAGGVAGVAQWMLIYPLDVIKTHIQIQKDCPGQQKDWIQTWRAVYKKGGVASFYVGIAPALSRAFVTNASCFLGTEAFLRLNTSLEE